MVHQIFYVIAVWIGIGIMYFTGPQTSVMVFLNIMAMGLVFGSILSMGYILITGTPNSLLVAALIAMGPSSALTWKNDSVMYQLLLFVFILCMICVFMARKVICEENKTDGLTHKNYMITSIIQYLIILAPQYAYRMYIVKP
jgi:hypothetical protein